jgi:transposase
MAIVGGMDIHRKQVTFDYLDTVSGEVRRGQIRPADRAGLRAWLARFAGRDDVAFAIEGCTGWRYVAEELAGAGIVVHLAEPADTAAARGRKRRAKTDRGDSRHLRELLAAGRLPECWIPPPHVLDCRALLEAYHDLRQEHTAWVQRIHAVLFHQGAPVLAEAALSRGRRPDELPAAAAAHLTWSGQLQVAVAVDVLACLDRHLDDVRGQIRAQAQAMPAARQLAARLYGIGPAASLALACWLGGAGRFSSSRQAVRFTGLDITVWSSDGKRSPGRLSRQGPPVLRWALYEAAKTHARASAPDHAYYAQVKDRCNGKRAALSEARKLTRQAAHILAALGDDALTPDPGRQIAA